MVTIKEWYERVNAAWPKNVPPMTNDDALNAAKRLYRFVTGKKLGWSVEVTSGNRYTWGRSGTLRVNPSKGWKEFVHDFSHWLDRVALWLGTPGRKPHAREHAKLELRLVREVIRRGWLNPKTERPRIVKPEPTHDEVRTTKRKHAERMHARAMRRLRLAQTLEKKWRRRVDYYSRPPRVTLRSTDASLASPTPPASSASC